METQCTGAAAEVAFDAAPGLATGQNGQPQHAVAARRDARRSDLSWTGRVLCSKKTIITLLRTCCAKVSVDLHDFEAIQDLRLDVDHLRTSRDLPEVHPGRRVRRRRERLLLPLQILLRRTNQG